MNGWHEVVDDISSAHGNADALLAVPLAELREGAASQSFELALDMLQAETGARTVGDLIQEPEVDSLLREVCSRGERRAFLREFTRLARRKANALLRSLGASAPSDRAGGGPAARPSAGPSELPRGGAALEAWCAANGVGHLLDQWIELQIEGKGKHAVRRRLRELVDVERFPQLGIPGVDREFVRERAGQHLLNRAKANAPLVARRNAFLERARDPEAAIAPFVERLARLEQQIREQRRPSRGEADLSLVYPVAKVTLLENPLRLVIAEGTAFATHQVRLEPASVQYAGAHWHGSEEQTRGELAVLRAAIDALRDPTGEAQRALAAWLTVPAWKRIVQGLTEEARPTPRDNGERIAFRVSESWSLPVVLVQAPRKNGGYTPGRMVEPYHAFSGMTLTEVEREILDALASSVVGRPQSAKRVLFRVLDRLSSHPRVYWAEGSAPVRVQRGRARLAVTTTADGYCFRLRVGAVEIEAGRAVRWLSPEGGFLVADRERGVLHYGELDEKSYALLSLLAEHPGAVPMEGLDAVLGALQSSPGLEMDLELPEEARGRAVEADGRPLVRLELQAGGSLLLAVRVRPLARGAVLVPGTPPQIVYGSDAGSRIHATRRLDEEAERAERLLAALPLAAAERAGPFDVRVADPDQACDVAAALAAAEDAIVEWARGDRLRVLGVAERRDVRLRVQKKRDWFGVDGSARVGDHDVGLAELLAAARAGRRFVRVSGGDLVALGNDLRAALSRADDVVFEDRGALGAHAPAVDAVSGLVASDDQVAGVKEWLAVRERWRAARDTEPDLPSGLKAELRHYQVEGYRWLARLAACEMGACLADDMGLGKTLQALALLLARAEEGPALVLAPTSVCSNWADEARRFAPGLRLHGYRGAARRDALVGLGPHDVVVASYDVAVRDVEALRSIPFATLVLDEAHALKNAQSKRALAARELPGAFRVALTGTPVENHLGELWSLFRVILPGLFGSWERFRERFAGPIERDKDPRRRAALAALVRPYLLRRTKREVSPELPPRTELVRYVELSAPERRLYEAERRAAVASLDGRAAEDARFAIFAALTRLRQLACHPRLRDPESPVASSKLAAFVELADEIREGGSRGLIFSQFTSHLGLVAEALRERGVPFQYLDGSTPAEARAERVRAFQGGQGDFFLISLKAGGVGLNLTAADFVIHLDPWWNPAAEDQASDRAHRIGQDKPVTIVRLIAKGTIEEKVLELHGDKREIAEAVLSGGDAAARLSTKELVAMMERGDVEDDPGEGA